MTTTPGRPPIGPRVAVKIPPGTLARIDAHRGDRTRSQAIRDLLELALDVD